MKILIYFGFLLLSMTNNFVDNSLFVPSIDSCPGVLYGAKCYWSTREKHLYHLLDTECGKNGGYLTYFPNEATRINFENYYADTILKYQEPGYTLYVGLRFISTGEWKLLDGSDIPSGLWTPHQPSGKEEENCVYIMYNRSQFRLRDTGCTKSFSGLCGKDFNVSKDRYSVENGRVLNSNLPAFYSPTPSHCTQACFQIKWCKSCNYNKVNFQCELNSYTREDVQFVNFHNRSDYLYMTKMIEYY